MASDEDEPTPRRAFRARLRNGARIETTVGIMATSETDALQQVWGLSTTHTVELYEGSRLITIVPKQAAR